MWRRRMLLEKQNLFDKNNPDVYSDIVMNGSNGAIVSGNTSRRVVVVKIQGGCTYEVHKDNATAIRLGTFDSQRATISSRPINYVHNELTTDLSITTSANAEYLYIQVFKDGDKPSGTTEMEFLLQNIETLTVYQV